MSRKHHRKHHHNAPKVAAAQAVLSVPTYTPSPMGASLGVLVTAIALGGSVPAWGQAGPTPNSPPAPSSSPAPAPAPALMGESKPGADVKSDAKPESDAPVIDRRYRGPATQLPQQSISGNAPTDSGLKTGRSRVGKMAQDLKDIPNAVTVIPEQLMADRNADTLKEALRNVASLTFNAGEGGRVGDNITLRGYSAVGDLYLDGLRDIAQYNRETFNLESIDVLRGSAGMLFGRGATGGIINQVSKQPRVYDVSSVELTYGTNAYRRATADLHAAVDATTAFRMSAVSAESNSWRNGPTQQRAGLAPTVGWGLGTDDELILAAYWLKDNNIPDYGVPFFNGRPAPETTRMDPKSFFGITETDFDRNQTGILTGTYLHRFSKDLALRTVLRSGRYERDLWAVAPRFAAGTTAVNETTVINRQRQARGGVEETLTSQTDLTGAATLWGMKHEFLTGVELMREKSTRWTNTTTVANPATTALNPTQPVLPPEYLANISRINFNYYTADTVGVYAQDTVSVTDTIKLVAGLRFDDFSADYNRVAPLGPLTRTDRQWSKRAGLIWQPSSEMSYYASWGTSFNPSGELYQLDDRSANTPPEENRNIELGAKFDLLDGDLALRTALFRTEKTNERNTDLSNPTVFLLNGKRHTDGVEIELAGRITKDWEVFGALAVLRGKVDEASGQQGPNKGKKPINTPDYTFSLWSNYQFTQRWRAGLGVEAVGTRYGNATNTNAVPAYVRTDAMVEYAVDTWKLKLNLVNLADTLYYEGVYSGHVVPGARRTAQLTYSVRF